MSTKYDGNPSYKIKEIELRLLESNASFYRIAIAVSSNSYFSLQGIKFKSFGYDLDFILEELDNECKLEKRLVGFVKRSLLFADEKVFENYDFVCWCSKSLNSMISMVKDSTLAKRGI